MEICVTERDRRLIAGEVLQEMERRLRVTHGVTALTLDETMALGWGGVIVRQSDMNQLVDNSLGARLALAKRMLRNEALRLLMPSGAAARQAS